MTSFRLVLSFVALILFVAGCALVLFPHLPVVTSDLRPYAGNPPDLRLSLTLLIAGLVILLATRRY